jgi:hypothetical protein
LGVYMAEGDGLPIEVLSPPSPRKYWTRRCVAEWLVEQLGQHRPTPIDRRSSQIDPLLPFQTGPMNGQIAQLAVVRGRRAKSTRSGPT